jgi:FHA domain-containing protein
MRSPWSPLPKLSIATVAISQANVVFAAGTPKPGRAAVISDLFTLAPTAGDAWLQLHSWFGDSFNRAPALMLVLAVLMALPPLAVAGLMMRRQRRSPDSTVLISRPSLRGGAGPRSGVTARNEVSAWPTEAWVEFASSGQRYVIGRAMLRIGREADNDICRSEKTVHRYHAVIRRTTDGDVVITDLSGADGNGVLINGTRVGEGRLVKGDVISIGEVKLKFDSRPV